MIIQKRQRLTVKPLYIGAFKMKYHKSPADLRLDKLQAKKILNEIRRDRRRSIRPMSSSTLKGCVAYFPKAFKFRKIQEGIHLAIL